MNGKIEIYTEDKKELKLRTIKAEDKEILRTWKNKNRSSFFYQEIIQPQQQSKWFEGYCSRPDDYMFMVEEAPEHSIGCMAFRLEDENTIDLYNIIRGEKSNGYASMKDAMYLMLTYIHEKFPDKKIKCDVLKNNPAVQWYQKCGFAIWQEKEYYIMGISITDIPTIRIESKEE